MNLNSNWTYCNLEIPSPEGRGCSPGAPRLAVLHGLRGGREGIQLPCWGPACLIPSCMDWAAAPIQWPWEGVSGNVSVWEHCGASRSSSGETKLVEKPSSPAQLSGAVLWARLGLRKPHPMLASWAKFLHFLGQFKPNLSPWHHSSAAWSMRKAPTIKGSPQTTSYPAGNIPVTWKWVQSLQLGKSLVFPVRIPSWCGWHSFGRVKDTFSPKCNYKFCHHQLFTHLCQETHVFTFHLLFPPAFPESPSLLTPSPHCLHLNWKCYSETALQINIATLNTEWCFSTCILLCLEVLYLLQTQRRLLHHVLCSYAVWLNSSSWPCTQSLPWLYLQPTVSKLFPD